MRFRRQVSGGGDSGARGREGLAGRRSRDPRANSASLRAVAWQSKSAGPTLCPCHRSVPGEPDAVGRFDPCFPFRRLTGAQRRPGHKQAPRPWPSPFERGPPYPGITYVRASPVSRPATCPQGRLLRCAMGASPTACGAGCPRGLAASRARRRGTTDAPGQRETRLALATPPDPRRRRPAVARRRLLRESTGGKAARAENSDENSDTHRL